MYSGLLFINVGHSETHIYTLYKFIVPVLLCVDDDYHANDFAKSKTCMLEVEYYYVKIDICTYHAVQ